MGFENKLYKVSIYVHFSFSGIRLYESYFPYIKQCSQERPTFNQCLYFSATTCMKYVTQNYSADWVVQECDFCQVKCLTYVEYNQQKERQIKECLRLDARRSWSCRWLSGSRLRSIRSGSRADGHVFDCWWRSCHSRQHWEEVLIAFCLSATFSHAACEIYRTGKGLISLVTSRGVCTVAGTGRVTPSHANKRSVRQLGC